ncbi:MAG TPA: glycosyltransferase family 9 protein [Bryobacteraceae bacterium]|nr:glycosyltransferase family 9 protein [Bryobacteraceae bacterium]
MKRLLIRPGALGDCILSLPAMEHLARGFETEVWAPGAVTPLTRFSNAVRSLASTGIDMVGLDGIPTPDWFAERIKRFDSIVSWYGSNRPEFRDAITALGVPCEFLPALPPTESNEHAVDFFARQVGAPAGLTPRICIAPERARGSVIIHPFSGSARKNWPLERYREVADRLARPIEWTAGATEELPGAYRFGNTAELAQWLAGAGLYIGNDSGVTHLAAALGVPVIANFVASRPEIWAPRGPRVSVLVNPSVNDVVDRIALFG